MNHAQCRPRARGNSGTRWTCPQPPRRACLGPSLLLWARPTKTALITHLELAEMFSFFVSFFFFFPFWLLKAKHFVCLCAIKRVASLPPPGAGASSVASPSVCIAAGSSCRQLSAGALLPVPRPPRQMYQALIGGPGPGSLLCGPGPLLLCPSSVLGVSPPNCILDGVAPRAAGAEAPPGHTFPSLPGLR